MFADRNQSKALNRVDRRQAVERSNLTGTEHRRGNIREMRRERERESRKIDRVGKIPGKESGFHSLINEDGSETEAGIR